MRPIDYRNASLADLKGRLQGQRREVLAAWREHGPGTTSEVAHRARINILTFRPRTTELYQLGALRLVNADHPGHEGIYEAVSEGELVRIFTARVQEARREQQQLLPL